MESGPRRAIVDGADLSLPAFLLMPVFAAALSVTMWLQLPTFSDALHAREDLLKGRREVFARLAASVPIEPVRRSRCAAPLSPPPHFDEEDRAGTNVAVLSPDTLTAMNLPRRLNGDQELYFRSQVAYLVQWVTDPPFNSRRMSRARIAAEIEQPIENNRYVLFYGTTAMAPPPEDPTATIRVDAFLYDVSTGARVCDLALAGTGGLTDTGQRLLAALAGASAAATTRPR